MYCTRLAGNAGRKNRQKIVVWAPSHNFVGLYLRNEGMYRHSKKNLLSSNISPTCPYNMVNFSLVAAEIVSLVWDTSASFNGFRDLASLLQRRRSMEANQTFHDVRPLPGLVVVDYIYIFGGCCSVMEFCQVQNSLCVLQVLRSPIGSVTARHSCSAREPNFAALSTGRHLYLAGWPSRWALAHISSCVYFALSVFIS